MKICFSWFARGRSGVWDSPRARVFLKFNFSFRAERERKFFRFARSVKKHFSWFARDRLGLGLQRARVFLKFNYSFRAERERKFFLDSRGARKKIFLDSRGARKNFFLWFLLFVCRVSVVVCFCFVRKFSFGVILVLLLLLLSCCRESKQHAKRFVTVNIIDQIATKMIREDKNSTRRPARERSQLFWKLSLKIAIQDNGRNYSRSFHWRSPFKTTVATILEGGLGRSRRECRQALS